MTNTNRQVQMGRPVVPPPGEAKEDWWIEVELAKRLGLDWSYSHPREVFAEMKINMPSLDNITWERLEKTAVTYPSLSPEDPGQPIVFGDGFPRPEGRARFTPANVLPPDEVPDADYPFVLITGRQLEHWHTGSMTRRSNVLDTVEPEANCSMHPRTLREMGIAPGDYVQLTTRRGSVTVMVRADRAVAERNVFLPFAYVEAAANILTNAGARPLRQDPRVQVLGAPGRKGETGRGGMMTGRVRPSLRGRPPARPASPMSKTLREDARRRTPCPEAWRRSAPTATPRHSERRTTCPVRRCP